MGLGLNGLQCEGNLPEEGGGARGERRWEGHRGPSHGHAVHLTGDRLPKAPRSLVCEMS